MARQKGYDLEKILSLLKRFEKSKKQTGKDRMLYWILLNCKEHKQDKFFLLRFENFYKTLGMGEQYGRTLLKKLEKERIIRVGWKGRSIRLLGREDLFVSS